MKRIVVLWALVFGFLPLVRAQDKGVTAELSLEQNMLLPDEDMNLVVHIENRSGQDIDLGKDADWISFSVTGDNNTVVRQLDEASLAHEFTLHSAAGRDCSFNLTPFFDFRAPGHYTVSAVLKIPQWQYQVKCQPVNFTIVKGMRLPKVQDIPFGVPPLAGAPSNAVPVGRRYVLQKVDLGDAGQKLYFQLTDETGARTLKVFQLGRMIQMSDPETQIDRFSNLHVLNQTGAQVFSYYVINPDGQLLFRQTYEFTTTRPKLATGAEGEVKVAGGVRRATINDFPAIVERSGAATN